MRLRDPYRSARRFSIIGVGLVLLTLLAGGIWLVLDLAGRSFFDGQDAEVDLAGLNAPVEVVRDGYGIPYITASTEPDAMAGLGYAHAQDRLWQMDLFRRFASGRMSEILGPRLIGLDAFMRTIGIVEISEKILAETDAETLASLESYASGVNAFIDESEGFLPFEFDALDYAPDPWHPVDCILIMRLLAWEQNTSLWSDLALESIYRTVDSSMAAELHGWYPSDAPTIVRGGQVPDPRVEGLLEEGRLPVQEVDTTETSTDSSDVVSPEGGAVDGSDKEEQVARLLDAGRTIGYHDRAWRAEAGIGGSGVGSNAWAVSGERTLGGKPILANDPHLQHSTPAKWYQAVLLIGERRVAGVTIPGVPWIVIGRNDDVAWGITNLSADETDFYFERLDPEGGDRVLHDGRYEELSVRYDTIVVRDSADTPITIRSSRHGPLLSDRIDQFTSYPPPLLDTGVTRRFVSVPADSLALAIRWLGREVSHELRALRQINRATNFGEFRSGAAHGGIPGMSLIYADRHGTIGYVPAFRAPIRPETRTDRVNPGWSSRYNWRGVRNVGAMPTIEDPSVGFIASANNKLTNSSAPPVGTLWVDPARAARIDDYLVEGDRYEQIDAVQMQSDIVSHHMILVTRFLLNAFPDSVRQGEKVREALARLRTWGGEMEAESPEAAIAAAWLQRVYERTWVDEMGPDLYRHFVMVEARPMLAIRRHLLEGSRWFDDVTTPKREERDDILRAALGEALDSLHDRFDTWSIDEWSFGAFHTVTFRHPFSAAEGLADLVNVGPYPIGGATSTLNSGEWNIGEPFDVILGPSMRQIVDFSDTTSFLKSVITSGQSGQPMNDRYEDQTIIWLYNGYVDLFREAPDESRRLSTVRLIPG